MGLSKKTKTEHSGAKNGGGHWGTREEAKKISKKLRREKSKEEIKKELNDKSEYGNNSSSKPKRRV